MDQKNRKLILDISVLILSVTLGWWIINTAFLNRFFELLLGVQFLAAFVAGVFFTSFITIPLSIATFLVLAKTSNPILLILLGGLGAVVGDLLIIKLFRESIFVDFATISRDLKIQKVGHFFKNLHFSHLAPLIGLIIIATPFPDEIGLALLGISKFSYLKIGIITFILNSIGISLIILAASIF